VWDALVERTLEERWLSAHASFDDDLSVDVAPDLSELPWDVGAWGVAAGC
jgi:hypothetical protein